MEGDGQHLLKIIAKYNLVNTSIKIKQNINKTQMLFLEMNQKDMFTRHTVRNLNTYESKHML